MKKAFRYGLLVLGVLVLIGFLLKGKITHEPFDSEKWKNWTETEAEMSLRWDMMNSLRNNYNLNGMSKTEILELLGPPNWTTELEFKYNLGMAKRGIDTGSLKIIFDSNNQVESFYVFRG